MGRKGLDTVDTTGTTATQPGSTYCPATAGVLDNLSSLFQSMAVHWKTVFQFI